MLSKSRPVKKVETGDREWLYGAVLDFISKPGRFESPDVEPRPKTDLRIYDEFCPVFGQPFGRKTWDKKKRVTRRKMLHATLHRLVADGRIKVVDETELNLSSMDGRVRDQLRQRESVFGSEFDGRSRSYVKIDVLDGIVQALEASE